jgi:hypothetical protein
MGGKGLTCTTLVYWQSPNSIDSCRNQAITTHDSGLAGLGSGGVTGNRMLRNGGSLRGCNDFADWRRNLPEPAMSAAPLRFANAAAGGKS